MSEVKRYYLWVEKFGGSQEMLEHKGQDLPSQDLDAAGEYVGFNHAPLYVLADDHESKLAALREENRVLQKQLGDRWTDISALKETMERLADAERRNSVMADLLRLVSTDEEFFPIRQRYWTRIQVALNHNPEAARHDE
jgi:hypothetical protein